MTKAAPARAEDPVVFVIDDDPSMREALRSLFQSVGWRVELFASAPEFMQGTRPDGPACLVLDIRLPRLSGLEFQTELAEANIELPIIFITGHGDIPMSVKAMKAGAVDFLTKPVDRDTLLAAVSAAVTRDAKRRAQRSHQRGIEARFAALLLREREVFEHVVAGKLNKQIAAELGIAERTVKAHRAHVMEKMQAESLAELVLLSAQLHAHSDTPE